MNRIRIVSWQQVAEATRRQKEYAACGKNMQPSGVVFAVIAAVYIGFCCYCNVQGKKTKAIKSKWPKDDTKIAAHNNNCVCGVRKDAIDALGL